MKIIIIGAGEVGRHLALSLANEGHEIIVIEQDEALVAELDDQVDAKIVLGDGCSASDLAEQGVSECELVLGLTSSNNANLVSCSISKKLGAKKVICRVHPGLQRDEFLFNHRSHFGIDHIFSSERLAAVEFAKSIRNPTSMMVEEIARGRIELQKVRLSQESDAAGKTLRELKLPARVRIGAIARGEESFIPEADTKLKTGDFLTVFGEPSKLHNVVARLQNEPVIDETTRVVIFGGGEYGFSLAEMLEGWNCKTRIFEKDPDRCEELTNRLARATVLNVDATSLAELREEQVGKADFFVAASSSDEDNVMSCLQAHNIGAKNCLTLIHRADYAGAISTYGKHFGIRSAVSPREATRLELMRFVTSDRYHTFKKLPDMEVIEMVVRPKSRIVGEQMKEIKWPPGSIVIALIRGIKADVPGGEDKILAGDNLYALVSPEAKDRFIKLVR